MNIVQKEIVVNEYGEWPCFHDAEILSILVKRGVNAGQYANLIIEVNVYYTKSINEGTAKYETIKINDNVITIEFYEIDDLILEGFNYQNVIDGLAIKENKNNYSVEFVSIFGVQSSFACNDIAVLNMVSKNEYHT